MLGVGLLFTEIIDSLLPSPDSWPALVTVLNLAVNDVSASQISRRFDGATAEIEHENVCFRAGSIPTHGN